MQNSLPIRVNNPRKLPGWEIDAERVRVASDATKPSLVLLPDSELVMAASFVRGAPNGKRDEWTGMWRSRNGGKSWSDRTEAVGLLGREQWLSCASDGTLFATGHLSAEDFKNPDGYTHSYLHRSSDSGQTWERMRIGPDGFPTNAQTMSSRNVVELPYGTLLLGVSANGIEQGRIAYVWSSRDGGSTWDRASPRVSIGEYRGQPYDNWDGFFCEDYSFHTQSGRLLHFIRCGPPSPMFPLSDDRVPPVGSGAIDRTLRCESTDLGQTWGEVRDCGDYGMHYPRVTSLQNDWLLMTFTQRSLFYPIGLQAVLSFDDGITWNFDSDRIYIEGKSAWGMPSGGGFGNTVQLLDGTLVSCSTFCGDNQTPLEVVRWQLPM